jgi:hypothetical protein
MAKLYQIAVYTILEELRCYSHVMHHALVLAKGLQISDWPGEPAHTLGESAQISLQHTDDTAMRNTQRNDITNPKGEG